MELPSNREELDKLQISKRMQAADLIGQNVSKIMNSALKKANKFLLKYGYKVSVTMNFHEIGKDE